MSALPPNLSPREAEILRLVGRGLSNKQIAAELGVSSATVKSHIANARLRLGRQWSDNRAQLALRVAKGELCR